MDKRIDKSCFVRFEKLYLIDISYSFIINCRQTHFIGFAWLLNETKNIKTYVELLLSVLNVI